MTLSIPISERAIIHRILPRGYISQYNPYGKYGMSVYWEIHLAQGAILKDFISNIPLLKIIYCTVLHFNVFCLGSPLPMTIASRNQDVSNILILSQLTDIDMRQKGY